jgi:hypothetical protein
MLTEQQKNDAYVALVRIMHGKKQAQWVEGSYVQAGESAKQYWLNHPKKPELDELYKNAVEGVGVKLEADKKVFDAIEALFEFDFVKQCITKSGGIAFSVAKFKALNIELEHSLKKFEDILDKAFSDTFSNQDVDKKIDQAFTAHGEVVKKLNTYSSLLTSEATDYKAKIMTWPIDAFVNVHVSKGREYFAKGCAVFNSVSSVAGGIAGSGHPGVGAAIGAVLYIRDRIEEVADEYFKHQEAQKLEKGHEAGAGLRAAQKDKVLMTKSLYKDNIANLHRVLDLGDLALSPVPAVLPAWKLAKATIEKTVESIFETKVALAETGKIPEETIRGWLEEGKEVIKGIIVDALSLASPTDIATNAITEFASFLVSKIVQYVPMKAAQTVSGEDLLAAGKKIQAEFVVNPLAKRGGHGDVASEAEQRAGTTRQSKRPTSKDAQAPATDAKGRTVQATDGQLGTGEWKVKINDIWGILDRQNRFQTSGPSTAYYGPDESAFVTDPMWKDRYLDEQGYREGGVNGSHTGGRWYEPWPGRHQYLFVEAWPFKVSWVRGIANTYLGQPHTVEYVINGSGGKTKALLDDAEYILKLIRGED